MFRQWLGNYIVNIPLEKKPGAGSALFVWSPQVSDRSSSCLKTISLFSVVLGTPENEWPNSLKYDVVFESCGY